MMNFCIILISVALSIEATYGMDISLCLESTLDQYQFPGDCTKYIQCNNGQTAVLSCGSGSQFNPESHKCDPSYVNKDCDHPAHGQPTLRMFCKNVSNGAIPHPFDCTKFIECSSAISTIKQCGVGLVYNPATGTCDWPRSVKGCSGNSGNGEEHRNDVTFIPLKSSEKHSNQVINEESKYNEQKDHFDSAQHSVESFNHQVNEDNDDEECEDDV